MYHPHHPWYQDERGYLHHNRRQSMSPEYNLNDNVRPRHQILDKHGDQVFGVVFNRLEIDFIVQQEVSMSIGQQMITRLPSLVHPHPTSLYPDDIPFATPS